MSSLHTRSAFPSTCRAPVHHGAVAVAVSIVALLSVRTAFADEPSRPPRPTPPPVRPQEQAAPPGTTTTGAPYSVPGERIHERTVESRPNSSLLSSGTGLFILSYGSSALAGMLSDRREDKRLYIPVVGPWLDLGQRRCNEASPCGTNEDIARAMIVTSGVVQGLGVLMALGSLVVPETTTTRERIQTIRTGKPSVVVSPLWLTGGAGLSAVGRF